MEEALDHFPGAIVLVSHDSYLLRRLANWLLQLPGDASAALFEGGLDEYEEAQATRLNSSADPQQAAEIESLELQLARMIADTEVTEDQLVTLMSKISETRRRLDELRAQLL